MSKTEDRVCCNCAYWVSPDAKTGACAKCTQRDGSPLVSKPLDRCSAHACDTKAASVLRREILRQSASLGATIDDLLDNLKRMVRASEQGAMLGNALGNSTLRYCTEMAKLAIAKAEKGLPEPAVAECIATTPAPAVDDAPLPSAPTRGDLATAKRCG